ncbi:MAG: His/Gly/Thr/Pro-type tRNA ligase C-terminal domain-containing protein, partial [Candidatus Paceibacterota bacterium]
HRRKVGNIKLEIFGCKKSIAEALLLRTALAILTDHKHKHLHIDINSRGCRNSSETFLEEYKNYYRKHANKIPQCCQTKLRNNPLELAFCGNGECSKIRESAPRSIAFLSEGDRVHLKEVIEYIESMSVPYCINSQLVGPHEEAHPKTLFQIKSLKKKRGGEIKSSTIVARGERFDYLTYDKEEEENENHAVSISIDIPAGKYESYKELDDEEVQEPNIYFVHISAEAKRESLPLLEELRKKNIQVRQALMRDSLWQQMRHAEHLGIPYVVILGLQEVKEREVIVRNLETQAQETVPFSKLAKHLKKIA